LPWRIAPEQDQYNSTEECRLIIVSRAAVNPIQERETMAEYKCDFRTGDKIEVTATQEELVAVYADPKMAGKQGTIKWCFPDENPTNIQLDIEGVAECNHVGARMIKKI
jgi:hypothetical protein